MARDRYYFHYGCNAARRSKQLLSDSGSNVLLFLSGHGGDGFLKFRDVSNVQSHDLSDALETMRTQRRFREMLVLVDTCQAATIPEPFITPRVTSISSSLRGENSYASAHDNVLGQALLDRFTHATLQFVKLSGHSGTVSQLVQALAPKLRSDYNNPQTLDVRATQVRSRRIAPRPPRRTERPRCAHSPDNKPTATLVTLLQGATPMHNMKISDFFSANPTVIVGGELPSIALDDS